MNRQIKFRVYNKRTKQWIHGPGQEVNLLGEMILLGGFMKGTTVEDILHHVHVLQYTGMVDADGKEIYEGDILSNGEITGIVRYESGAYYISKGGGYLFEHFSKGEENNYRVIGNVYDGEGEALELTREDSDELRSWLEESRRKHQEFVANPPEGQL